MLHYSLVCQESQVNLFQGWAWWGPVWDAKLYWSALVKRSRHWNAKLFFYFVKMSANDFGISTLGPGICEKGGWCNG